MSTSFWVKSAGVATLLVSAVVEPHRVAAQDSGYFHALAIPPASVGTCIVPASRKDSEPGQLTRSTLVITSREPGQRREITVRVDTAGRVVSYDELGFISTGLFSSEGENVLATIDATGHMYGRLVHISTVIPDSMRHQLDTAGLRKLQESGVTKTTRESLDAEAQRRVLQMAEWLRKRCPA